MNNLKTLSITFGLALIAPFSLSAYKPLYAQQVMPQNDNIQNNSPYNQSSYVDIRNNNINTSVFPSDSTSGNVIDITAPNATNTPITSSQPLSPLNIPPLPTNQPETEIITIKGSSTPVSPVSSGKTIVSNRKLPSPPNISEPYRKYNDNNTTQVASKAQNNTSDIINTSKELPRIINQNPSSNSNTPSINNTEPIRYGNSNTQRRSLADILIVAPTTSNLSPSSSLISNNSNYNTYNSKSSSNQYKIIVELKNSDQEFRVRSLYPDAFRTTYNGRSMLQVGVFSNTQSRDQVLQSLKNAGLNPLMINN